jgi:hypothetical protein
MGEQYPGGSAPQAAYERGDLSAAEEVTVASSTGATDEKHASGSYGAAPEVLGDLVHKAGAL